MLVMVALILAVRSSLIDHHFVTSSSMEYSLMPGDCLVVDKTTYGLRIPFTKVELLEMDAPKPGEIVVFDSPGDGVLQLVKRIVAVGGDSVELRDGKLWIDGAPLGAKVDSNVERFGAWAAQLNLSHGGGPDIHGFRVPENTVLVLGDHRGNSFDGRFFGVIPERDLYGRAVAVYYRRDEGFWWKKL